MKIKNDVLTSQPRRRFLPEILPDFITHLKAAGRAESTVCGYLQELQWLTELLGTVEIAEIGPRQIEKAIEQMRQSRLGLKTIRGASTMNRAKSICRVFFRWMHAVGMIPRDPSGTIAITRIQPKHTVPISDEEFDNLIAVIRRHGGKLAARDEALFSVYAYTGMRRSEALNLRVGDFDIKTRSLSVHGKGGCVRDLPVPVILYDVLVNYLHRAGNDSVTKPQFPSFPGRTSPLPLCERQADALFRGWRGRAGIRCSLTIHSFRARYASRLYEATLDLLLVARLLGHSDPHTTLLYITYKNAARDAIEATFAQRRSSGRKQFLPQSASFMSVIISPRCGFFNPE